MTRSAELAYRLEVPEGWLVEDVAGGALMVARDPDSGTSFAANVNVVRCDPDPPTEPAAVLRESIAAMQRLLADFVALETDEGAEPRLLYTFRQGEDGVTAEQRYVFAGDTYFVVTATAANSDWRGRGPALAAMLDSFELVESPP